MRQVLQIVAVDKAPVVVGRNEKISGELVGLALSFVLAVVVFVLQKDLLFWLEQDVSRFVEEREEENVVPFVAKAQLHEGSAW